MYIMLNRVLLYVTVKDRILVNLAAAVSSFAYLSLLHLKHLIANL